MTFLDLNKWSCRFLGPDVVANRWVSPIKTIVCLDYAMIVLASSWQPLRTGSCVGHAEGKKAVPRLCLKTKSLEALWKKTKSGPAASDRTHWRYDSNLHTVMTPQRLFRSFLSVAELGFHSADTCHLIQKKDNLNSWIIRSPVETTSRSPQCYSALFSIRNSLCSKVSRGIVCSD